MELKQILGEPEHFFLFIKNFKKFNITFLNKNFKTVISFNKPKKHVMSTDCLPFISLTNIYLDLERKK